MSETVDQELALMLRHAAKGASDYGDVRLATGFDPAVMRSDKESNTFGYTPFRAQKALLGSRQAGELDWPSTPPRH